MRAKYCNFCGGSLVHEPIDGVDRGRCGQCNRIHYEQLIVGAGAIVENDGQLLLIRRKGDPFKGYWGLPAGHVEANEDPVIAAIRETEEETGLQVRSKSIFDAYFFDDHPKGCGVFLVYRCEVIGGTLVETAEAMTPTYFSINKIPRELAGGGHSKAILAWRPVGYSARV